MTLFPPSNRLFECILAFCISMGCCGFGSDAALACEAVFLPGFSSTGIDDRTFVEHTGTTPVRFKIKTPDGLERGASYLSFMPRSNAAAKDTMVLLATDGQSAQAFSQTLQAKADSLGKRIVYLGVDSSATHRTDEYISPPADPMFTHAEAMFLFLRLQLISKLGLGDRGQVKFFTFGFSNGAVFSLQHALKYPQYYDGVIALSVARPRQPFENIAATPESLSHLQVALGSGTAQEERMFRRYTAQLRRPLGRLGIQTNLHVHDGGRHAGATWVAGLDASLSWLGR